VKSISCFADLAAYGIEPLTGEACGLMYRILFDLTAKGQTIVEKCLGCRIVSEPWNRGTTEEPHVASVMLSQELLVPLGIFALLQSGCTQVWLLDDRSLVGIEPSDTVDQVPKALPGRSVVRTFRYGGTAGDRNVHLMSGRIQ
jgi:hypothetical protein